jgi:hypothetical protein
MTYYSYNTRHIHGKDACVKAVKKDYPRIGRQITRGGNSLIFEGSKSTTVFKLTTDDAAWGALTDPYCALKGRHFPKMIQKIGQVGENSRNGMPLYLMEIERLENPRGAAKRQFIKNHLMIYRHPGSGGICFYTDQLRYIVEDNDIKGSLKKAILQIADFAEMYDCYPDIHEANILRRGQTWVFSDPVASRAVVEH